MAPIWTPPIREFGFCPAAVAAAALIRAKLRRVKLIAPKYLAIVAPRASTPGLLYDLSHR
jgi:hypothetical protein